MTSPDLNDLITRVLSGSGPDRELDALVYTALFPSCVIAEWPCDGDELHAFGAGNMPKHGLPPLTANPLGVGHCLALMDEVLPEWVVKEITNGAFDANWCNQRAEQWTVFLGWIGRHNSDKGVWSHPGATQKADHKELPRAILAAILRAKAQEAGDG